MKKILGLTLALAVLSLGGGDIARADGKTLPEYLKILKTSSNEDARADAAMALSHFVNDAASAPQALAALRATLDSDGSYLVRSMASDSYFDYSAAYPAQVSDALLEDLRKPGSRGHKQQISILGRMSDARALPLILDYAAKSTDEDVRAEAAGALSHYAGKAPNDALVKALMARVHGDGSYLVRSFAGDSLASLAQSTHDPAITDALVAELKTGSSGRKQAADALGHIEDPKAVPALLAALKSGDGDLRTSALSGLSSILPRHFGELSKTDQVAALQALAGLFQSPERYTRSQAALLLAKLLAPMLKGNPDSKLAQVIQRCIRDTEGKANLTDLEKKTYLFFDIVFFAGVPLVSVDEGIERARNPDIKQWSPKSVEELQSLLSGLLLG